MTNIYCIRPKGFNVGNEAIHVALREQLNEAFGEQVNIINLPATGRYESHAKAGFTAATVHEINQYGDGVIVGGGNLYENGELDVDRQALKALDVPLMLYSLSMGRIYDRRGELVRRTDSMPDETLRALHEAASISLARDEATVAHLADAGVAAELGGCPTIGIDRVHQHVTPAAAAVEAALISLRAPELMSVPLAQRNRVRDDVRRVAAHLAEEGGLPVRLLCHDHRDIPFAASFGDIPYLFTDDVYEYLSLLRSARVCVSYRLHAALPCLALGTPVVKISYDERGNSTMATIGLREWNIDIVANGDVFSEVADRLGRLGDLDRMRESSRDRWDALLMAQKSALGKFAGLVGAQKDRDLAAHTLMG